ncbi:MAG: hypothetical protein SO274_11310, partial [Turicibacter bilis]|nr:hypothetical protein [Turicibacter bilis]
MAKLRSTDLNGNLFVSGQLKLVNPFLISTDSLITNLNADLLDGYHANDLIVQSSKCYDTSTSDTKDGTWTVSIPGITELTEGLTIKIRLKRAGASTCTLNLNGLGAKTVYFRYGSKLTSQYSKESVIALTYTTDAIGSGTDRTGWIVENIYDTTNTYQLRTYYSRYTTKTVLYRYMICFVNKDNLLIPANNVSNSTATNKTLTTDSFDLTKGIYYYNSTSTVAANELTGNGVLYQQLGLVNLQYSFNTGKTLTAHKPVYVVVTPTGTNGEVVLASNPIAQTLPTTDDGNRYVFLGYAYDTYRIELTIDHPVYVYNSIAKAYVAENYSHEANIKNLQSNFVINSQAKGGFVSAGGTNYNKVWKTDWSGNPAWRDVITYRDLGVDTKFQNLDLATERDVIYYTTASAVVSKLSPLPTGVSTYGEAFVQTVWCGSVKYLVQDFTWRSGTNFRRFSRTCNNGTFGPWYEYAYKNHLDNYQPKDGDLTAIAGLSGTGFLKRTGDNTWSLDTIDPTQYYWANVKISKTSSNTTFPRFKSLRAGNTVYNIATLKTTLTPVETVLHTGIKWTSSSYMPVIHLTGYAYGLTSPVEFKIGFYIYNNQIGWCGVTNMGAWKPDVLLFKDTRNGVDYVAVGLKGSCYFLMLEANLQENMNDIPSSISLDPSLWYFRTQTADQVTANGSTIPAGGNAPQSICVKVPYKTIRTNVDSADKAANSDKLNGRDASYYLDYNNFTHTPTILTQEDIQTAIDSIPYAGSEDIIEGITGRTKVEWNALNAGEYGSNSTYNGTTLPPVMLESNSGFWNSSSGTPLDVSFHFAKKEKMAILEVFCPPYGGVNPTMSVYYAQEGDTGLTLYK